jgi:hypothetical protein
MSRIQTVAAKKATLTTVFNIGMEIGRKILEKLLGKEKTRPRKRAVV